MARVAEFHWRVSPPAAVDEELAVFDDGSAWLVVRRPRTPSPAMGSYRASLAAADLAALAANGPGPFTIDLLAPEQPLEALLPLLERVHQEAMTAPEAVATFHGRVIPGARNIVLAVVASGERPVQFELAPARCAVHFIANGQPLSWQPFPQLETGFIAPDASGFGGLSREAVVPPGGYGVVSFAMAVPEGADAVRIQVAGQLRSPLPDDPMPGDFEVRTDSAEITP